VADNEAPRLDRGATLESPSPAATSEAVPATAPEGGRRRSNRRWLIIGAIAVIFLVLIGYVVGGAAAAGGEIGRADSALKTAVSHNNTMAALSSKDPFRDVNFTDVGAAKSAVAQFKQQVSAWQADVSSDRKSLLQVRADLGGSFLTLPEQSTIDNRRHRVDAALSALKTAQKAFDLSKKQMAFLEPFLDSIAGFEAVAKAGQANDLNAMASQLTATAASLQKAVDLAQPPAMPSEFTPTLKALQQLVKDMQALVSAAKAQDLTAVQKYAAAVEADGKALETIDQSALDKAEKALFKPLSDAYDRDMKTAAGG
jgi:hypothetical protein